MKIAKNKPRILPALIIQDARFEGSPLDAAFSEEEVASQPLKCWLRKGEAEKRDKSYEVDKDLARALEDAIQGKDEHWKLLRAGLCHGEFVIVFADMKTKTASGTYRNQMIKFSDVGIKICVDLEVEGEEFPYEYDFELFDAESVNHASNSPCIVRVTEWRNDRPFALGYYILKNDDFYYVRYNVEINQR